ncbi:Thiol-disulfide oxidoreductase ResA [Planctomycetes bacterium Pan216]|uniref:Thiol-disulfide oxidoreductase ResA n=1 Tax=Kolteria novifilia TaxID=2527975 RepID=A0A518B294_9BACT|nr:Thiol-disulfide oxidoreductase ResA [Planctomycetes bacterium Pan216]
MTWHRAAALVGLASLVIGGSPVLAATPSVDQILALQPKQEGIVYDIPEGENRTKCKLQVLKKPSGWVLHDHRGFVIRRFIDANGDNVVDRWSYYMNGQEVYRESDTNGNGKADDFHWYNTAGSRWGVDSNEDGRIDGWKRISAQEASAEAVAAIKNRDFDRMARVLFTETDIRAVGLGEQAAGRAQESLRGASAKFRTLAGAIGTNLEWTRFDGHSPMSIPSDEVGSRQDLIMFQNGTIIADAGGRSIWLRVPEIVRVNDTWKLTDIPTEIDAERPIDAAGVIIPTIVEQAIASTPTPEGDAGFIEENDQIREYIGELEKLDRGAPTNSSSVNSMVKYHIERAKICAQIGAKSSRLKNREHWYEQTADSLNAAVQTGGYPQGIATLEQYGQRFDQTSWGKGLAAYFLYRAINSDYALALQKEEGHVEAQEKYLSRLAKFNKDYPESGDAADALLQLGNGMEFTNKEEEAVDYYRQLLTKFPNDESTPKAEGALRRLQSVGQPFMLAGNSIDQRGQIDTRRYRGKILVVSFWATWCDPCMKEMGNLKKLREKHAKDGLEIVGVCLDGEATAPQAMAHLRKNGYTWPQIYEKGSMESAPALQYGVISLPYVVLIDADGRVINRNVQYSDLDKEVERAIARKIASRDN